MKKIIVSLVMVLALGVIVSRATAAWFSDTETSTGNTFSAGTLDLTADGKEGTQVIHITRSNMVPNNPWSHSYGGQWILKNVGTVPGVFSVKIQNIQNGTTVCNGPKIAALAAYGLPTCVPNNTTGGQLGTLMYGKWMENHYGIYDPAKGWAGSSLFNPINSAEGTVVNGVTLNPGDLFSAYLDLEWDSHTGTLDNTAQGDVLSFDVVFTLDQVH